MNIATSCADDRKSAIIEVGSGEMDNFFSTFQDCDPGRILLHCYVYIMRRIACTYLY